MRVSRNSLRCTSRSFSPSMSSMPFSSALISASQDPRPCQRALALRRPGRRSLAHGLRQWPFPERERAGCRAHTPRGARGMAHELGLRRGVSTGCELVGLELEALHDAHRESTVGRDLEACREKVDGLMLAWLELLVTGLFGAVRHRCARAHELAPSPRRGRAARPEPRQANGSFLSLLKRKTDLGALTCKPRQETLGPA